MVGRHYRVLIVEIYGSTSHIVRFIRNLKLQNPLAEITLLSDRPRSVFPEETIKDLTDYSQWKKSKMLAKLSRFQFAKGEINAISLLFCLNKIRKKKHYDIINIHYPQFFMCCVMGLLKKMTNSIVVSPWGSDVLRLEGKRKRHKLAKVFQKADYITANPSGNVGKVLVEGMRIDSNKLRPMGWGSETIDYINEHISDCTTEEAKKRLGLGDRYVITCGYNAFEEQRHELMIKAIESIKKQLPKNLVLLFPVTYGYSYGTRKKEYVEQLKKQCEEVGLDAVFYEDYLSLAELFNLRMGTDMFVHIQTTDAGNSSLQEYVLCGKKVVHGAWIHYKHLEKYSPLFYYPVEDLEHLDKAILSAFYSDSIRVPHEVMDYIRNRGWKAKMKLWNEFFVSIC